MLDTGVTDVEILVVAGGGGAGKGSGANYGSGGGGAGGLILSSSYTITPGIAYEVVVGNGGAGSPVFGKGSNGENSYFDTIIATGGGGGGEGGNNNIDGGTGSLGGSGGGGGGKVSAPPANSGSGVVGQGNDGGAGGQSGGGGSGGGGGGAGAKGQNGAGFSLGQGGAGLVLSVTGVPTEYARGGNGGNGVINSQEPTGLPGTGNGGNGTRFGIAGTGASGTVIVSYTPVALKESNPSTTIKITEDAISGSVNNSPVGGISGEGTIGFLTVSRTGSSSFTLAKNNISVNIPSPATQSANIPILLNGVYNGGIPTTVVPYQIAYASIGAGLTDSEVSTYYNLVSQFQTNLKRQNTLLDNYSGAAAAYSLRRIGPSGYFGPAIRVRRDSDNTLRDIGFTSDGQLDTVGLLDFVGVTGSGFVQTWYDQLYNNNPSEITTTKQPLVVETGSIKDDTNSSTLVNLDGLNKAVTVTGSFNLGSGPITMLFWIHGNFAGYYPGIYNRVQVGGHGITTAIPNNGWVQVGYQWDGSESYFIINGIKYQRNTTGRWIYDYRTVDIPIYINNYPPGPSGENNNAFTLQAIPGGYSPSAYSWTGGPNIAFGDAFSNYGGKKFPGTMASVALYSRVLSDSEILDNYNSLLKTTDPDYQSFITATGITQPTQSAALETLVSDLKSYGLWSKMKAIYPMVTDRNNRFAQSEDFSSTWNAQSASVSPNQTAAPDGTTTADLILDITSSVPIQTFTVVNNGESAYTIDGSDNPALTLERGKTYDFDINASGHPFYIMTGSGAHSVDGQYNTGVTGQGTQTGTLRFVVPNDAPDTLAYVCQIHSSMGGTINVVENSDQHYIYQTIDGAIGIVTGSEYVLSTYAKFYNTPYIAFKTNVGAQAWFDVQTGATGSYTGSNATITNEGNGWYRCALYFTSSETTGPYNQQIHLARTDNDLTFAGTGTSGSYLWGAQFENGNLLGPYRKTEGSGFAVSGSDSMLDQMKFNLKNPVDTDAGFRLGYNGTINPGYDGIKTGGNPGNTGFLNTNMTQSTIENTHFSIYRTDQPLYTGGGRIDIGITSGNATLGIDATIQIPRTSTTITAGITSRFNNPKITVGTNKTDMYIISRVPDLSTPSGSYSKTYKGSTLINTYSGSLGIQGLTGDRQICIGALDYYGGLTIISNSQTYGKYPFATIGDGLTDYEAKALYWIVQKFQTTLGRQVY
jgi:hypothetical protein